jgi:hypothetical protein
MKKATLILLLLSPLLLFAGGNPGNPLREFTVEDTVRWTFSKLELNYNEGFAEDMICNFSSDYSDVNGITINSLTTIFTQLVEMESFPVGDNLFQMYNTSVQVIGNQAVLTATIVLEPVLLEYTADPIVVQDTATLERVNGGWIISSAPHLVAGIAQLLGTILPTQQQGTQPNQASYDEYYSTHDTQTDTQSDIQNQRRSDVQ